MPDGVDDGGIVLSPSIPIMTEDPEALGVGDLGSNDHVGFSARVPLGPGDHETLGLGTLTGDGAPIEEKLFFEGITDYATYAALPKQALRASGLLGPIQAPSFPETITIGAITLTPTGGGNRTPGNNDYNATITPVTSLVAEIVAAINDPLNSFASFVFAVNEDPYVRIIAKTPGAAGNSIVLTSSDVGELYGPWPTATQGIDFSDGGGGADIIFLNDGSTWAGLGFPAGPQTIVVANAEDPTKDGTYGAAIHGGIPAALALGAGSWGAPGSFDDNTATITRLGLLPAPGSLSGGADSQVEYGDYARVTTGTAKGAYRWIERLNGTPVQMWLPADYSARITDYVRDASGNPCKISTGIGGDTKAILDSRGWSDANSINGTVADAGGDIELQSNTGVSDRGIYEFIPADALLTRRLLQVMECDIVQVVGSAGSKSLGAYSVVRSVVANHVPPWQTWAADGNSNQARFMLGTGASSAGNGAINYTAYQRMFNDLAVGYTYAGGGLGPEKFGYSRVWLADNGLTLDDAIVSFSQLGGGQPSAQFIRLISLNSGGGVTGIWRVREFHLFELEG
jgi:hypothetical protein